MRESEGGAKFLIRAASERDSTEIAAIYGPYVTDSLITFEEDAPSPGEVLERFHEYSKTYPWLVAEEAGHLVGFAYASPHRARVGYRWSVDVTVYLPEGQHRKGIATQLYSVLLPTLKAQGFANAYAGIRLPNEGSVGLHESFGFQLVGVFRNVGFKFGQWNDVGWWEKALGEHLVPPPEPIPFEEWVRTNTLLA